MSEIARLQADPRARLSAVDPGALGVSGLISGTASLAISTPPPISAVSTMGATLTVAAASPNKDKKEHKGFMTLGPKRRLQKALMKMNILPKNTIQLVDVYF